MAVTITGVQRRSPAQRAKLRAGDVLLEINGHEITDVLDYMFYASECQTDIKVRRGSGELSFSILKGEYDDLGLEFSSFLMDEKQSCTNRCIFCFIDQMPPGMRPTLYFKDDDARLSFLQGNYVTLTNLSQRDVDRIIQMKLNINVSVHTTNPELRCRMMNNRFAGEKLDYLFQMGRAGIQLNCQIVLCPGWNDGAELDRTLNDLASLMPSINSIAVVPVGLTKFRKGLTLLQEFDQESASQALDQIEAFQKRFLEEYGTRLVFASDEFYLKARRELPPGEAYEEYPQYENGVGLLRCLLDDFQTAVDDFKETREGGELSPRSISLVTGTAAAGTLQKCVDIAEETWHNVSCTVYPVVNDFFGESITVTGLLTAGDIIRQLKGKELGQQLLLPASMLRAESDVFLDDLTVQDVSEQLSVRTRVVGREGQDLLEALLGLPSENAREIP